MNLTYEKRGPGKFDDSIDEWVYEQSMDGCDEEAGSVDEGGWYGLLRFGKKITVDDVEAESKWVFVAAIMHEDNEGFIYVDYFDDEDKANEAWAAIEAGMDEDEEDVEDVEDVEDDDEPSENPGTVWTKSQERDRRRVAKAINDHYTRYPTKSNIPLFLSDQWWEIVSQWRATHKRGSLCPMDA